MRSYNAGSLYGGHFAIAIGASRRPCSSFGEAFFPGIDPFGTGIFLTSPVSERDERRILFAAKAIARARTTTVHVRVTNVGRADAIHVTFEAPDGYSQIVGPDTGFDLPAGDERRATYKATTPVPRFKEADFEPLWSATQVVDVAALLRFAVLALVIFWLPFLLFGLWLYGRGQTTPNASPSQGSVDSSA